MNTFELFSFNIRSKITKINHTHIVQNIKSEQNIQLSRLRLKEKCCKYTETTRTLIRLLNLNKTQCV